MGTSIDGKKYQPKGRGSKWQNADNGRFSTKPGGSSRDGGVGGELYGTGDDYCPEEYFDGSVSVGARASIGVGYGATIDFNKTYPIDAEPEFSVTVNSGFVVGARAEGYVSVQGTFSMTF